MRCLVNVLDMDRTDPFDIFRIVHSVRPYSMVSDEGLRFTIYAVRKVIENRVDGAFVECGVWKGGASIAMLLAQKLFFGYIDHSVHMFDSFKGLPPAEDRDGPAAIEWQNDIYSELFFDNCRADFHEFVNTIKEFGFGAREAVIWSGQFSDTLPNFLNHVSLISLLRIDCDWYASVKLCLKMLGPRLSKGAVVILDDYYAWDGCARAVHEYLSENDLPHRIRQIGPNADGAYFVVGLDVNGS